LAFILRTKGSLDHALAIYNAIIEKGGEPFDSRPKSAVLAGMGRLEEAADILKQAISMSADEQFEEELAMILGLIEARKARETGME